MQVIIDQPELGSYCLNINQSAVTNCFQNYRAIPRYMGGQYQCFDITRGLSKQEGFSAEWDAICCEESCGRHSQGKFISFIVTVQTIFLRLEKFPVRMAIYMDGGPLRSHKYKYKNCTYYLLENKVSITTSCHYPWFDL